MKNLSLFAKNLMVSFGQTKLLMGFSWRNRMLEVLASEVAQHIISGLTTSFVSAKFCRDTKWTKPGALESLLKVLVPFIMNHTSSVVLGGHIDNVQHIVQNFEPHHIGLNNLVES